ncbi:MAG: pantoate--beta-alanine ligase [Planctomycetota bacterium]
MHLLDSPSSLRDWLADAPRPLALVPTMGALHDGHLALIDRAREPEATHDRPARAVVVSVFVNPTQFGPDEDFDRYPRDLERDLALLRGRSVDAVFTPTADQLYPPGRPEVAIDLPELTAPLEGEHRPGHFAGVCRVCLKLFNLAQPDYAVFGEKDYQQLAVMRAMVADLDLPMSIVGCPTIREPDGLAMSSRNRYLTDDRHAEALGVSRALSAARKAWLANPTLTPSAIERRMADTLIEHRLEIDYAVARHPDTLHPLPSDQPARDDARLLIAVTCGATRLIDNAPLSAAPSTAD